MKKIEELEGYLKSFLEDGFKTVQISGAGADKNLVLSTEKIIPLDLVKDNLLNLKAFKGVENLTVLKKPVYEIVKKSGSHKEEDSKYLGEKKFSECAVTVRYGEDVEFNDNIDLYSITLGQKIYDKETVEKAISDCGVYRLPTDYNYDKDDFRPVDEIRIKWRESELSNLTQEEIKERILSQVSDLIDNKESNIPAEHAILIRCSKRSIKGL